MRLEITLDCNDLGLVSRFWAEALGWEATIVVSGRYVALSPREGSGPFSLTLQQVAEPKTVKNRMHLDVLVADLDAEADRLRRLGAREVSPGWLEEYGTRWIVLADPEGNEFCLGREPRSEED